MSNIVPFNFIPENVVSQATPGLWNSPFSAISQTLANLNANLGSGATMSILSDVSTGGGVFTAKPSNLSGVVTIHSNSNVSDYLSFVDSANARSNYLLGSHIGGTADGLNLYDNSGATMIVSFSKQSVRFYQQVVGPVFDVGGALASTYNAATFGTGADSKESRIQSAINQASLDVVARVYIPASMYPYSASSVSFIYSVQMVREGGNWATYDPIAYGATGNGVHDDAAALRECASSASGTGVPVYLNGIFAHSSSSITFNSDIFGTGTIKLLNTVPSGTACATLEGAEHTVQGVKFDATNQSSSMGLRIWNAQRTKVIGSQFTGARRGALKIGSRAVDTEVLGCTFTNPGYGILYDDALAGSADSLGVGLSVIGCVMQGDGGATSVAGDGIEINAPVGGFGKIVISNNRIRDYWFSTPAAGIGIGMSGVFDAVVADNVITGCAMEGVHVEEGAVSNGSFGASYNVIIRNNSIDSCGWLTATPQPGISFRYTKGSIVGNLVRRAGSSGIVCNAFSSNGASSMTSAGLLIANNVVENAQVNGIYNIGYDQAVISGNVLNNNSAQTPGSAVGIAVTSDGGGHTPLDTLIIGNLSFGTWHKWQLDLTVATHARVLGNSFGTGGTAVYRDLGSATEFAWNHVTTTPSLETFTNPAAFASDSTFNSRLAVGSFLTSSIPALAVIGQTLQQSWSDSVTDATNKTIRLGALAYETARPPAGVMVIQNTQSVQQMTFGGGSGAVNAMTHIRFNTSNSTISTTGVEALRIGPLGQSLFTQGSVLLPSVAFSSASSFGFYNSGTATVAVSGGTLNLATNTVRLSMRTLGASASSTNMSVDEVLFSINGASGASLAVRSGGTIWIFNSSVSTVG